MNIVFLLSISETNVFHMTVYTFACPICAYLQNDYLSEIESMHIVCAICDGRLN